MLLRASTPSRTLANRALLASRFHLASPASSSSCSAFFSTQATGAPLSAQQKPSHKLKNKTYDAVIIGGGHNGLTCAAYLAKAGLDVVVAERRHVVGGAAITEEIVPGFKFSRASYLNSLFRPQIVEELNLKQYGFEVLPRDPYSFTPLLDGRSLMLSGDHKFNHDQIAQFSQKDAIAYAEYEAVLSRLATKIEPLLDEAPPDVSHSPSTLELLRKVGLQEIIKYFKLAKNLGSDVLPLYEIMTAPASQVLDRWFESEPLKSTLATDAIIGAMVSPSTPTSGYVLFHHVMGETNGVRGVWAYVRGGMGTISQCLAKAGEAHGATILTNAPVASILIDRASEAATGVVLEDGTEIKAKRVISGATPEVTYLRLMNEQTRNTVLPNDFRKRIETLDYTSPVTKINVALDRLPQFKALPWNGPTTSGRFGPEERGGPQHRGTIHFTESTEEIEVAYREAFNGHPSKRPVIEMTLPSVLDSTVAPPGKHVAQLFVQYTPYKPKDFSWDDPGRRDQFADSVFNVIEQYCPGFKASVIGRDILTPVDLERVFGLTGGNIFHGAMSLNQLFWLRPASGFANYRSPVKGLYMCGAGTHPGGGVMGAPGRNASKVILDEAKKK